MMSKRKETRKRTLIKLNKEFKRFKKTAFVLFKKKYGDPYLYQYAKKYSPSKPFPKHTTPTQYHLHLISGFVNNKSNHYNSYFKDQQIFISDIEYLLKLHSALENRIVLATSYQPEKHLIPNLYPQGNKIMNVVHSYYKDISKFPFQGRRAYFRYTVRTPSIMNIQLDEEEGNSDKESESFDKEKDDKKISPSNSLYFLYKNEKQEEDLNMTIHANESCFFDESLLNNINEKSQDSINSNSNIKNKDMRRQNTSIESIEQIIEDINLLEEDKKMILPKRKENSRQMNLDLKNKLLITSIRNELKQTSNEINSNKRYKLKTRKEKLCFLNMINKLQQNTESDRKKSSERYKFDFDFSSRTFHKHTELFLYGKASHEIKTQQKRNFMRSVLLDYNQIRLTKEKELKRKNFFFMQKQITKPKSIYLKTEERIQNSWNKYKNSTISYQGLSNSRTISHKYCDTIESEQVYCRTHKAILNPNVDHNKYKVENSTRNLIYKIQKSKEHNNINYNINKSNREIRTKQISMLSIACCPDIYNNYGMRKTKVLK